MRYLINNHEIEFDRKAMKAAHQAFPLEFAEWNLALKLKGKALLPGVRVREIPPPYLAEGDNPKTRWPLRPGDPGYDALKKLEAVAEAAGKYRGACEDFEHMCERAVEEGWGDDPTGSTHVSSAADCERRSLAALDAALEAMNT